MPALIRMEYLSHSQADTFAFGRALGAHLAAGDCVLLTGDLGAGKSVLARGIAAALGIEGPMPSPSFTILIPYEGSKKLYHFDLYRLADPDEFYAAGLDEFLGGDGVSVIEWPQMAQLDPLPAVRVHIARGAGDDERVLSVQTEGLPQADALAEGLEAWRTEREHTGD